MIMYEIKHHQIIWQQLNTNGAVTKTLCGERPPINAKCSEEYLSLMQDCWAPWSQSRPDFSEIVKRLEEMIINAKTDPMNKNQKQARSKVKKETPHNSNQKEEQQPKLTAVKNS